MKKAFRLFTILLQLAIVIALNSCGSSGSGNSKYYDNGYKFGLSSGKSDVRGLRRITDSSDAKYISSDKFNAYQAYELKKRTTVGWVDDEYEDEYKNGFIDGYNDGVQEELGGTASGSSNSRNDTSTYESSSDDETGIKFWHWIIILIVTTPIISWLGFGKSDNGDDSESGTTNNEPTLVSPWKSLMLVLFTLAFYFFIFSKYDMRVNNWSVYFILIMCAIAFYSAYENAKNWTRQNGASIICWLVKALAIILSLVMCYFFCTNLYNLIFD